MTFHDGSLVDFLENLVRDQGIRKRDVKRGGGLTRGTLM